MIYLISASNLIRVINRVRVYYHVKNVVSKRKLIVVESRLELTELVGYPVEVSDDGFADLNRLLKSGDDFFSI